MMDTTARTALIDRVEPLAQKIVRQVITTMAHAEAQSLYLRHRGLDMELAFRSAEGALRTSSVELSAALGEFVDGVGDVMVQVIAAVKRAEAEQAKSKSSEAT